MTAPVTSTFAGSVGTSADDRQGGSALPAGGGYCRPQIRARHHEHCPQPAEPEWTRHTFASLPSGNLVPTERRLASRDAQPLGETVLAPPLGTSVSVKEFTDGFAHAFYISVGSDS
jgi:hypothetical protein